MRRRQVSCCDTDVQPKQGRPLSNSPKKTIYNPSASLQQHYLLERGRQAGIVYRRHEVKDVFISECRTDPISPSGRTNPFWLLASYVQQQHPASTGICVCYCWFKHTSKKRESIFIIQFEEVYPWPEGRICSGMFKHWWIKRELFHVALVSPANTSIKSQLLMLITLTLSSSSENWAE